jgi:hypothetical protein
MSTWGTSTGNCNHETPLLMTVTSHYRKPKHTCAYIETSKSVLSVSKTLSLLQSVLSMPSVSSSCSQATQAYLCLHRDQQISVECVKNPLSPVVSSFYALCVFILQPSDWKQNSEQCSRMCSVVSSSSANEDFMVCWVATLPISW